MQNHEMKKTANVLQRKVQLHAVIDAETKERMKREANSLGLSLSGYVNLCTRYFQDSVNEGSVERTRKAIVVTLPTE